MNKKTPFWKAAVAGMLALLGGPNAQGQLTIPLNIQCPPSFTNWICDVSSITPVNYPTPTTSGGNCSQAPTVTCSPPSGAMFILGTTTVTCVATDRCGQSDSCSFRVTVARDTTPPVLNCPTNRTVLLCGTASTTPVNFPPPTATDNADTNVTVTCVPASGSFFSVGVSTVNCTARDDCGNTSSCSFVITVVRDTVPPVIRCPGDTNLVTCTSTGATVNYPPPVVSDNLDASVAAVCTPASGSTFPVGNNTVSCTARDDCGNTSTCSFLVIVNRDATPPAIQCPTNIIVWSCEPDGIAVNYPAPTANDDSGAAPAIVCQPPSGSVFQPGVTVVTCTATDDCTNRNSCSFQVRVARDTTPPSIVCPANRIRYTCDTAGGPAIYPPPDASDNEDPHPEIICTPPFGAPLPLGTNVITCVATDRCGNSNSCSFTIDMRIDTIPPVITCPGDIVVDTCDPRGVVVTWPKLEVTDNFVSNPQYTCTPKSGSVFPIGKTTVVCEARDSCGNTSQCSFKVTVIPDAEIPGTDTDGNGLSDIWQSQFDAHGLAPDADTDGDGYSNRQEAVMGTNPRSRDGRRIIDCEGFTYLSRELLGANVVLVTVPGKRYQVQGTADLGSPWQDIGAPVQGSPRSEILRLFVNLSAAAGRYTNQGFFRAVIGDLDEDGDGVTAWEESILGTSDLTANTHGHPGGDHQAAQDWLAGNVPQPRLREVALAHLGGSPNGPTQTKLVTATGTGGWLKLSSWTLNPGTTDPTHLQDTAPFEGWNAKLHVLEPPLSPTLSLNPFVSGRLRDDGNLWLTTRRVDAAGVHADFETIGYGANASFRVYDYAMTHRVVTGSGPGQVDHFILITPVMGRTTGGQKQLRLVTWRINPNTGNINGLSDTGDLGHTKLPEDGGRLQIVPEAGSRYVVSYVNSDSELSSWFFDVNAAGIAGARGGKTSGVDIRGDDDVVEGTTDFALGALNSAGFVTLLTGEDCTARLAVWEDRVIGGDGALVAQPFFITDNTLDQSPTDHGILLTPPTLTDSTDGNGALVKVRGLVTDQQWEQTYGTGGGELFLQMPAGEPTNVHAASVTKCMTLLVAADLLAMPGINADLDDPVLISQKAAGTGGSFMGDDNSNATLDDGERPILEGDKLPLRLLISGMMAPSCNKSSRAIGEYLGQKHRLLLDGTELSTDEGLAHFVGLMNDKAVDLEMNATVYGDSWGGGITTPQDLVTLWAEGWKHELFRIYSSATLVYSDCGIDAQGEEVCFFVQKSTPWYPGLEAWKGGAGGFFIDGISRPLCTRCLLGQSTRLGRSLIAALQQSGDRSEDAARLWDYGYRLLFTPDYRGGGGINTPAITDFALRKIHDTLAVSAVIYGNDQLRLDAWQVVAGIGQVSPLNASSITVNNLPVGTRAPRTKILDVTKLPTVGEAEADYLTGHLDGGDLRINVWRVGAEPGQ